MSVENKVTVPRRKAQWLRASTQDIPPIAFAIPSEDFERLLQGFPNADEALLRRVLEAELLARYGSVVAKMEAKRDTASENVEYLSSQRKALIKNAASTPPILPDSEPTTKLPRGLKRVWVISLVLAALAIGIFDLMTAAGFVARSETHDLLLAICFAGVIPLAGLAVESGLHGLKLSTNLATGLLLGLFTVSLALFLWLFAAAYAAPQASLSQILETIGDFQRNPVVDKRPLLLAQLLTGIVFCAVIASGVRCLLVRFQRDATNPNWVVADEAISRNHERLGKARDELAIPAGNLSEWQNSIDASVNHAHRYIAILRKRDELNRALRAQLSQGVAELNQQLSNNGAFRRNGNSKQR